MKIWRQKINRKEQLSLVVTHEDFVDDDGNPQELHFFDITVATEEPPEETLLPDAIETELGGVNNGRTMNPLVSLNWCRRH